MVTGASYLTHSSQPLKSAGGERVGGFGWKLAFNVSQRIRSHSEALKIGSRNVEVNFIPTDVHVEDLVDHLRIWRVNLVANLRWRRRVRRGLLAGLGHTESSNSLEVPTISKGEWVQLREF